MKVSFCDPGVKIMELSEKRPSASVVSVTNRAVASVEMFMSTLPSELGEVATEAETLGAAGKESR